MQIARIKKMKITKTKLKQIIKEELESALNEEPSDYRRDRNRERYGSRMTRPNRKPAESDESDLDKEIYVLQQLYGQELERLNDHMAMVGQDQGSFEENVERMKEILSTQPNRQVTLQALDYILSTLVRPAGGGLGGPGEGPRHPTPEEIEDAQRYEPPPL
tara:strand:- start:84 stop:566 length:483 start_codon:yes stop_codon:yes gene_type:complete